MPSTRAHHNVTRPSFRALVSLHAGDLAKKKIYPALFALYVEGHLPDDFSVFGYARSKMSDDEFRKYIRYG